MSRLYLLPLALLLGAPALAQDDAGSTEAKPAERKICREYTPTGSRLGKVKVCKTRAEWEADRLQIRGQVDKTQNQRSCVQQYNC